MRPQVLQQFVESRARRFVTDDDPRIVIWVDIVEIVEDPFAVIIRKDAPRPNIGAEQDRRAAGGLDRDPEAPCFQTQPDPEGEMHELAGAEYQDRVVWIQACRESIEILGRDSDRALDAEPSKILGELVGCASIVADSGRRFVGGPGLGRLEGELTMQRGHALDRQSQAR